MASTFRESLESQALADVLAERIKQIDDRGHTLEADLALSLDALPRLVATYATIARDRATRGKQFTLPGARKKIIQAAALAIAAAERIDAEIARLEEQDAELLGTPLDLDAPDLPGLFQGGEE